MSIISDNKPSLDYLMHYGTKMHSGRYPWGSGEEPYQHCGDFINRVNELEKSGLTQNEIAKYFGMTSTNYRKEIALAKQERKALKIQKMQSLRDKGYSHYKIGEMMGMNESTVRSKLNPHSIAKMEAADSTYNFIKSRFKNEGCKYIDIGKDVERELNISRTKFDEAVYRLQMEGYVVHERYIPQATMKGQYTTMKALCVPDTELKDFLAADPAEIHSLKDYTSNNDGETFHKKFHYPKSLDSSRVYIRYAEDGGLEKDGLIEIRRGVDDVSLGNNRVAQVRILVDDTMYMKGMAVYSDDIPDGYDVILNSNKSKDKPLSAHFKEIKRDSDGKPQENPFGSSIKDPELGGQYWYKDKDGNEQLGCVNIKSSEGDWADWSNALPSQFLSKQNQKLVQRQLNEAKEIKQSEYEEICSLTNPTVKKKMLEDFADDCDSASVHLKAASLPRQRYHVIIPINELKSDEVYAPGYDDGETVALIRYPHGGTFEIPICKVNNKNAAARKVIDKDLIDVIGINKEVADRLSGADFDGDTVMVIPTNSKTKITSTDELEGLKGFDAKMEYGTTKVGDDYINKYGEKIKVMRNTENEMGKISNLITDMDIIGATNDEKARAVRHSMVVIDAEKHKLDYRQSEIDNNIQSLREKYQKNIDPVTGEVKYGGVSTIISRAKSQKDIDKTEGSPKVNIKGKDWYDPSRPEGALIYKTAKNLWYPEYVNNKDSDIKGYVLTNGKTVTYNKNDKERAEYLKPVKNVDPITGEVTFTNSTGELSYRVKKKQEKSTRMAEVDDAYELVSTVRHPTELLYADYANSMKALANKARKEAYMTEDIPYSPSAKKVYENEVNSLKTKLNTSMKNSPRERKAQALVDSYTKAKLQDNPELKSQKKELKKLKDLALKRARETVGAKRHPIEITDKEWEAIQAGAITKTMLKDILRFADMTSVKSKAMPRNTKTLSSAQMSSLKAKYNSGNYTMAQLAKTYGISVSAAYAITKDPEDD